MLGQKFSARRKYLAPALKINESTDTIRMPLVGQARRHATTLKSILSRSRHDRQAEDSMPRKERAAIISEIEKSRQSRVITYICSDRQGAAAQIGDDAVRPMYDHVRGFGNAERIDLYLYSHGGAVEVPWRIVTMLREHAGEVNVLIPYHAHSAATLIALGCDNIVMGMKGELGPIDPALNRITQETGTVAQEQIRVEDVMAYLQFLKDKAGLSDQTALSSNVHLLAEKLSPWFLGGIYRTHSHIRAVARRLLTSHSKRPEHEMVERIVELMTEKIYSHGHAIARSEALEIALPVTKADQDLDKSMWALLEEYETLMEMRRPVEAENVLGQADEGHVQVMLAMIESHDRASAFWPELHFRRIRQTPPQVGINLNLNVSLPQGLAPQQVPQEIVNQLVQQVQQSVPQLVQAQVRAQSAVVKVEASFRGAYWQDVTSATT